jgi:hypothetical protein
LLLGAVCMGGERPEAEAELRRLEELVPGFAPVTLPPGAGRLVLRREQSLTIERLRGVALDRDPPELPAGEPHPEKMGDDWPPGEGPYVARGIRPFRFRFFHNEFSYGGWHTWDMTDYAAAHGFDIVSTYRASPAERAPHLPEGTAFLRWGGFVKWHERVPGLRYEKLADQDVAAQLIREEVFSGHAGSGYDSLMIDLEHPLLEPDALREQPWYPADARPAEQRAFEARYYAGYAKTYTAPVQAARAAGWPNISLYGWQPFRRTWWGLEEARVDPETDWAWNAFGRRIYRTVELLNPSVYCFYWSPRNVAYTLANIDLNRRLLRSTDEPKPIRPYYWTLLHGGGGGWRWWRGQPLANEDAQAMAALAFFAGVDGLVLWNWSGTGDHTHPQLRTWDRESESWRGNDVIVGRAFACRAEGAPPGAAPARFRRYDALHVLSVGEEGTVRFQRIAKDKPGDDYGCTPDAPVYAMAREELVAHLRPAAEPVAALIEGLALVKPVEYLLRHGRVATDVPATRQFGEEWPIVRRVVLGPIHLLATYDPGVIHGGEPRRVVLEGFAGVHGRTLVLPADRETRIFVLRAGR